MSKAKQVKVQIKQGETVKFAKALDDIESMLDGSWKDAADSWQAKQGENKSAEQAPLFNRLLKIVERLR